MSPWTTWCVNIRLSKTEAFLILLCSLVQLFSSRLFFTVNAKLSRSFSRVLHESYTRRKEFCKSSKKNFSVWLQSFFLHWTIWTSKSSFVSLHFSPILVKANIFLSAKENWPSQLWISVPEESLMLSKSKDPNSGWKTDWIAFEEKRRKIPCFWPRWKEIVVGMCFRGKYTFKAQCFKTI